MTLQSALFVAALVLGPKHGLQVTCWRFTADPDVRIKVKRKQGDQETELETTALEDYIGSTYNAAAQDKRSAVGFVMTIYRKRLASSFFALRRTLESRLFAVQQPQAMLFDATRLAENAIDGEDDEGDAADEDTAR